MDKLLIRGGKPLQGTVEVAGAKNAALPELCAALLTDQPVQLRNVPRLQDVATMLKLIRNMGVTAEHHEDGRVMLDAGALNNPEAPYELVKTMRASVLALGPLLARFGKAKVSLPGGCAIGTRPIDLHLDALEKMGAKITEQADGLTIAQSNLKGAVLDSYGDHRTVMALSIAGLIATEGSVTQIQQAEAINKTFPNFVQLMQSLGASMEIINDVG